MFNYKFSCNECDHKLEFSNEYLEDKFPMYIPINMKNINEIIDKFKCSGCSKKNFILLDNNERVIFDMRSSVLCISCERHIPIPRLEAQTKSHLCITCVEEGEIVSIEKERLGRIFPEVPLKMKGGCPFCIKKGEKGFVVVRFNSINGDFFLGCNLYPKCYWTKAFNY